MGRNTQSNAAIIQYGRSGMKGAKRPNKKMTANKANRHPLIIFIPVQLPVAVNKNPAITATV